MDGTQVAAEPRVHLVGYGPSSSTIGANRAGRAAVAAILKLPGASAPNAPAASNPSSIEQKGGRNQWHRTVLRTSSARSGGTRTWKRPTCRPGMPRTGSCWKPRQAACGPDSSVAVIGDRYGALTLGALATLGVRRVRVHQDLITGERALRNNAAAVGLDAAGAGTGGSSSCRWGRSCSPARRLVLLQLPRTLAELEEIAAAVARHAAPDVVLLAGGRIKHMSLGMNAVLERHFQHCPAPAGPAEVPASSWPAAPAAAPGRRESRVPAVEHLAELDLDVAAHGAVFAGAKLDIGTRFLLTFLPEMPAARHAVDLGCGTGILAAMYARQNPGARVTATDQSAAAVASAQGTARANGLADRITASRTTP